MNGSGIPLSVNIGWVEIEVLENTKNKLGPLWYIMVHLVYFWRVDQTWTSNDVLRLIYSKFSGDSIGAGVLAQLYFDGYNMI